MEIKIVNGNLIRREGQFGSEEKRYNFNNCSGCAKPVKAYVRHGNDNMAVYHDRICFLIGDIKSKEEHIKTLQNYKNDYYYKNYTPEYIAELIKGQEREIKRNKMELIQWEKATKEFKEFKEWKYDNTSK